MKVLSQVLEASRKRSFELPDASYFSAVSRNDYWSPVSLNPWSYLPAYARLPEPVKLRYNQFHSLIVGEMFTLFEQGFLKRILQKKLKRHTFDPLVQECIEIFCREEDKHSEMFRRLNRQAAPEVYEDDRFAFIDLSTIRMRVSQFLLIECADSFLAWVWMAVFFEERTLMYATEYVKDQNPRLSPIFREAHELHMIEEARHVRMDEVFMELFFEREPLWRRKLAAWIFKRILNQFSVPTRSSTKIAARLKQEFTDPAVHAAIDQCLAELPLLKEHAEYRRKFFGLESARRTHRLLQRFPVMQECLNEP